MGQLMGFWDFQRSKELKEPRKEKLSFPSHTRSYSQKRQSARCV